MKFRMTLTALTVGLVMTIGFGSSAASAAPSSPSSPTPPSQPTGGNYHPMQGGVGPGTLVTQYKLINVKVYNNWTDKTRIIASCAPGANGTCTLSNARAYTTSVQVGLGASQAGISASLNFTLSAMNTTTVACQSPKMTTNQRYYAYAVGTGKTYNIQKWQWATTQGPLSVHKLMGTTGALAAFQPFDYPAVTCQVH